MVDEIPALMLVRLRARQASGTTVGARERSCHVVPIPEPSTAPEYLTAYCGLQIAPGSVELLSHMQGMPCEVCLGRSPIPAFAFLRGFVDEFGGHDGAV